MDADLRRADYVEPDVSEARIARLWSGVDKRLPSRRRARMRWVYGGAFALAAGVALAIYAGAPPSDYGAPGASLLEGAVFETHGDSLNMALGDGSSVRLDSNSRIEVAGSSRAAVELLLERGRVHCDVKHRETPNFKVVADGVEVRVLGTRFSVSTSKQGGTRRVEVHVERGVVEVRPGGGDGEVVRVKAGNSWSRVTKTAPAPEPKPALSASASEREIGSNAPSERPSASLKPAPASAKELLEQANLMRRQGKVRQAATAYEELLAKHSGDARAGLAAFELGRLKMDRLGDLPGAIQALERAVALAPGSGFREDALARLVTSNARAGNTAGCKRARSRYLQSFPQGVHRQKVAAQCGGDTSSP